MAVRPTAGGALEPLAYWAPVTAVLAAVLQMASYTGYRLFYESFGVSPDEVGLEYTTILVRSALQLVFLFTLALLLLVISSLGVALYGLLGWSLYRWTRRRQARWLPVLFPRRSSRYGLLWVLWLVSFFALSLLAVNVLPVGSDGSAYLLVVFFGPPALLLVGEHAYLRARKSPEPSLLDLGLSDITSSPLRRLGLIVVALGLGVGLGNPTASDLVLCAAGLFLLDTVAARVGDVEVLPPPRAVRVLKDLWSRRTRTVLVLLVVAAAPLVALANLERVPGLSQVEQLVLAVRSGRPVPYDPLRLNPFLLAQPRANLVQVTWLGPQTPPRGWPLDPEGGASVRRLTYFGQAQGTVVLYDPADRLVLRVPVGSVATSADVPS